MKRVCVFCGSNTGFKPEYAAAARYMGTTLARRGLGMVYGGGNIGLMGLAADAALETGGEVIGVIPQALVAKELAHDGLSELHIVKSMHERKAKMAELSDAFIAMPGGLGTFEEFCEAATWAQLGIHTKPCGLLNVEGFYNALLELFDHSANEGFLRPRHRSSILVESDPDRLLDLMAGWQPPALEKWIDNDQI